MAEEALQHRALLFDKAGDAQAKETAHSALVAMETCAIDNDGRYDESACNLAGMHAIEQALEWGVRVTGVTVHFAEETVDAGPPILQEPVPVMYGDSVETLTERIREVEHRLVPEVVRMFAAGRVRRDPVERRRVEVVSVEVE